MKVIKAIFKDYADACRGVKEDLPNIGRFLLYLVSCVGGIVISIYFDLGVIPVPLFGIGVVAMEMSRKKKS